MPNPRCIASALVPLLAVSTLLTAGSNAQAEAAGAGSPNVDEGWALPVRDEFLGLELSPLAVTFSGYPGFPDASGGLGASLRLGRRRWRSTYWTPVTAGTFVGKGVIEQNVLVHVMTEGGLVWRTPSVTLEVGLGLGVGLLVMNTRGGNCDGTCSAGGMGAMASPVVRVVFRDLQSVTVGAVVRAAVPLSSPGRDAPFGYIQGYGAMMLAGLDVGFGS
jgi:hypothetical protein